MQNPVETFEWATPRRRNLSEQHLSITDEAACGGQQTLSEGCYLDTTARALEQLAPTERVEIIEALGGCGGADP